MENSDHGKTLILSDIVIYKIYLLMWLVSSSKISDMKSSMVVIVRYIYLRVASLCVRFRVIASILRHNIFIRLYICYLNR